MGNLKNKKLKKKKGMLFIRLLNKLIKLKHLRILELSIGWVKGFSVKIGFYEDKNGGENSG